MRYLRFLPLGLLALAAVVTSGVLLTRWPSSQAAPAATVVGMVADDATNSVTVFDVGTDTVLGTVSMGFGILGDCSFTTDGTLGFVTNAVSAVWVIDLTTTPPSLASGTNPIPISNFGEDTSLSPDEQFLVVSDGSATEPISVIDIAARTEVSTFSVGSDHNSVEVLSDGSVLVTSNNTGNVRRLTIDSAGNLTDTGDVLFSGGSGVYGPNNVFGAPNAASGIVVRIDTPGLPPGEIRSFTIPGLALVDIRPLTGESAISGLIHPAGDRVYVRSGDPGAVDVYAYNSSNGELGATPLFSIPLASPSFFPFGMDQMAITPDGTKLYVSQPGSLDVYDASTGGLLTTITDSNIIEPTGVCIGEIPDTDGGKIYWTDHTTDKIQRANLDGSGVEDLVTSGLDGPSGIALDAGGGKMYWTDFGTYKIQKANLDGSGVEDLVTSGLDGPRDIELDVDGGKMYWTDSGTGKIQRANLDGSMVEDLRTGLGGWEGVRGIALDVGGGSMYYVAFGSVVVAFLDGSGAAPLVGGLLLPNDIALDMGGGKMYWTDQGTKMGLRKIQRANLDGSGVEDLVTSSAGCPFGIELDVGGGKMYWTDGCTGKIQRANLDGSGVEDVVTGLGDPRDIALDVAPPPVLIGDVDCDEDVDAVDALFILQNVAGLRGISSECPSDPSLPIFDAAADADCDLDVDAVDALFVLQHVAGLRPELCPP